MRIGEVAERAGVSTKTLRYYEEIGILAPPQRTASAYRDYDENVLDRLEFVRAAQAIGLTLGEIRQILALRDDGITPCSHVADLVQARADDIEVNIAELQRMRAELVRIARRARRLQPSDCRPNEICHIIGR